MKTKKATWNDLARAYNKCHSDRPAQTLPMDTVWSWAIKQQSFKLIGDTLYMVVELEDDND